MKRKLIITGISALAAILIFGSGLYVGLKSWEFIFPGITDLSISTAELIPLQMHIEQLDRGANEALRGRLHLQIDGQIIKTYHLLKETKDPEQIAKTTSWLKKIASYRKKHPPTYPPEINGPEQDHASEYVRAILTEIE